MTKTNEETNTDEVLEAAETAETEDGSALEVLRAENEELKNVVRLQSARDEIVRMLSDADAQSPGLLFAYAVDMLQFDDDGKLANAAAISEHLRKSFPEQFVKRQPVAAIDGGAGASGPAQYLTKDALAKMTPADIAKLDWAQVRQVLSGR
jgi:hypothetical protein